MIDNDGPEYNINIGGAIRDNTTDALKSLKLATPTVNIGDPFGETTVKAAIKSKNLAKGETVYIIIETLTKD